MGGGRGLHVFFFFFFFVVVLSVPDANRAETRSRTQTRATRRKRTDLLSPPRRLWRTQGADQRTPASIFSAALLFSFRRTFKVQQQSGGMLLQTGC